MRVQNGGARRLIRRQDEQGPVQPPRTTQRRIDVPGGVGGGQDVDALIVVADAVELFEELVDDTAHTRVACERALDPEGGHDDGLRHLVRTAQLDDELSLVAHDDFLGGIADVGHYERSARADALEGKATIDIGHSTLSCCSLDLHRGSDQGLMIGSILDDTAHRPTLCRSRGHAEQEAHEE